MVVVVVAAVAAAAVAAGGGGGGVSECDRYCGVCRVLDTRLLYSGFWSPFHFRYGEWHGAVAFWSLASFFTHLASIRSPPPPRLSELHRCAALGSRRRSCGSFSRRRLLSLGPGILHSSAASTIGSDLHDSTSLSLTFLKRSLVVTQR